MDIFKKRSTAFIILIICAIVATVIGVRSSLAEQADKIEDVFYNGSVNQTESIYFQLNECKNATMNVITITAEDPDFSEITDELRDSRNDLVTAMENRDITAMYLAYMQLDKSFTRFSQAASKGVSSSNADQLSGELSRFENAQRVISQSTYNNTVSEYERTVLRAFPVSILKAVAHADTPAFFGVEG